MPILTMNDVQDALKTHYIEGISYQMNETVSPLMAMVEKTSRNVQGKNIELVMRYGKQGGIGNRLDDGDLPNANSRKNKVAKWETKNIFARIMLTHKTIKASQSNKGSFINLLEAELEDALTDTKDNFNRQLFQDGTGLMATCGVATATSTVPVSSTRFFFEGQYIDILSSGGVVKSALKEVLGVDRDNKTIILDSPVTTADTDIICINGNYGQELTGLDKIFDKNSNLYGIDRNTHKWLNPTVDSVSGEISENAMQKAIDNAGILGGGKINMLLTTHGVKRAYQDRLEATKRTVNSMELKGGFTAISYNNIPMVADKYQAAGTMDLLNSENFILNQMGDWEWLDDDGKVLSRLEGKPVFQATLVKYADLSCDKPKNQARLTGIAEH